MNLTAPLTIQDFTTLASVKLMLDIEPNDCDRDELITKLISDVSARFVRYLGLHAVKAQRTEQYELAQAKKLLSLDAKSIDTGSTFTIKLGNSATDFTTAGEVDSTMYTVNAVGGWVRLRIDTPSDPNIVEVTYTGGLGTSTADLMTNFPELSSAAELQVKYLLNRRDSLGGNITVHGTSAGFGGGGTTYTGEYGLMGEVMSVLDMHRRTEP